MKYSLFISALILYATGYSQQFTISADKMNVLYIGLPNPISVTVQGVRCKNLILTADSADIETTETPCQFIIKAKKTGHLVLNIFKQKNKGLTLVGQSEFRAKYLPDPTPRIGGINNGEIRKNILQVQLGIQASLGGFDIETRYVVTKYSILIIRNDRTLFLKDCIGRMFDDEIKNQFATLKTSDKLFFYNINAYGPDRKDRILIPLFITIID